MYFNKALGFHILTISWMHGPCAEFKGDAAIDAILLWGQAKACLVCAAKVDLTGKPTGVGDFRQGHGGLCDQSTWG